VTVSILVSFLQYRYHTTSGHFKPATAYQLNGMADRGLIDSRQTCVSDDGSQGGKLKPSADPITKVGIGTDAVQFCCLYQCCEDVHRASASNAMAMQAHITTTRAHACL
jgi:hypothetical protein